MDTTLQQAHESSAQPGLIEATGELAKSLGRFSLAVSLFAARQATALLSSAGDPVQSLDDVSSAAGSQLTGVVKTAFAVGANVQCGLVDAAFSAADLTPRGQPPTGPTTGLSIPMTTGATRRVTGVRTVASGAPGRPVLQDELVNRFLEFHTEATSGAGGRIETVTGLWKSEGLATTIGKHLLPENTLNDPRLPPPVLPIAHVGFGSGSAESVVFDKAKFDVLVRQRCAPNYTGFSYEGIGAILRIYERGFFKVMSGALGLISLDAPDGPDPADFFAGYLDQFSPEIQRLIAHGYGRILAFSNMNIYRAIQEATTFPAERIEPAVHGAGFAFAFMNSEDLPRLLEGSAVPFDATVRAAFQNGLIYGLVFFDWYAPGLLAGWQPKGSLERELIEHARHEAERTAVRGYPLAFRLENPRS